MSSVDSTGPEPTTGVDETTDGTTGSTPQCSAGALQFLPAQTVDGRSEWVELFDLDQDGALDIVTGAPGVSVLRGAGDGTFDQTFSTGASIPRGFAFGDFDANGTIDLAVGDNLDGNVRVFPGNGDGSFGSGSEVTNSFGEGVYGLTTSDLDDDGALDIVVGHELSGAGVLWGRGDGTFDFDALDVPSSATTSKAADLDGDGKAELLLSGFASLQLLVVRGAPGGVPDYDSYPGSGTRSIAVHDASGDGVLDILTIESEDQTLTVRLGTSPGTFGDGQPSALGFAPLKMDAGDFDCDGRTDVAIVPAFEQDLVIVRGTGEVVSIPTTADPVYVAVGDLDGDGDDDVVVAGEDLVAHLSDP